jgi:hypothetical protein
MSDAYGSSAWDVVPYVQIAGICDNDSVVLDGSLGASIRWKSFFPVGYTKMVSWRRWFAITLMHFNGFTLLVGTLLLISYVPVVSYVLVFSYAIIGVVAGVIFVLTAAAILLATPALIRISLGGKFRSVQAALFGVEGYISPATAERAIFGSAFGRMSWSTNGSPLSRSYLNDRGELVGVDPLRDPTVREKVELAKVAMPGQTRVGCPQIFSYPILYSPRGSFTNPLTLDLYPH